MRPRAPKAAERARALVDELVTLAPGDTAETIRQLVPLGLLALEELSRSFPGPLWRPSLVTDSRLLRADEISASAEAVVAFGCDAIPYLIRLMQHPTSSVRYYAAVISRETPSAELVPSLMKLTLDADRACRRVALELVAEYEHEQAFRDAVATLRKSAGDSEETVSIRRRAISTLTELRDDASVSLFVDMLTDADRGIATASRIGLRVLTSQDFGFARAPWLRWLREHQHR